MPADGLSLSVLICGEPYSFGLLGQGLQFRDDFFRGRTHDVLGGKVIVDVNAVIAFGEVSDVTHR